MDSILVKEQQVTPRYIRAMKEYFNLSWSDFSVALRYDRKAAALFNMVRDPDKYLTPFAQRKVLRGIAALEKKVGHVHQITLTNGARRPPKTFGIAGNPRPCLNCKKAFYELPRDGFCSETCKDLFKAKGAKRK